MQRPCAALLLLLAVVVAAAVSATAAASPPLAPVEGEFCSEADGWEALPESDPGYSEVPEEVVNATVARFEDLHAAASPPWPHCFEDELSLVVQGCLQEVDGATTYWLRVNMTCAREDAEDSVYYEAVAVQAPEGTVEVLISDLRRLRDGSLARVCQDRACQVCPAVPAGGPNSTLSPSETCLECVGGLEQDPDSGVCYQGLGGGLEGSAPPVTCPYGTYPAPNGKCVRCRPGCAACRGELPYENGNFRGQICRACNPPLFLNPRGDCVQQCPPGSYFQFATATCQPCRSGCSTCFWCHQNDPNCINWQTCTACNPGTYFKGGACLPCNRPGCSTCGPCSSGPGTGCRQGQQCWSCRNGWYRYGFDCLRNCPAGQYYSLDSNSCVKCSRPGCATCRPCIKEIDGSNCQAGQWCTLCKQDWYINTDVGGTCKNCDNPGCNGCQRCKTGFPGCIRNQLCLVCEPGYALQPDRSCLKCTRPGCTGCKADANSVAGQACTACDTKAGYSLSAQGGCVKQCEPGTYWSETQGSCMPCADGCNSCRECADGSQGCENQQICANACQSGYWFDLAYQDSSNSPWGQCRTCTTTTRTACVECRHCAWPPAQPEKSCLPSGTGGSFVCTKCAGNYTLSTNGLNTCISTTKKRSLVN